MSDHLHHHVCPECDGFWSHGGICPDHERNKICPSCERDWSRKNDDAEYLTDSDPGDEQQPRDEDGQPRDAYGWGV